MSVDAEALIDEILALDLLTLRDRVDGMLVPLDPVGHRARLVVSIARSEVIAVRRAGELCAYFKCWPMGEDRWFVAGLAIHPAHRTPTVTAELLDGVDGFTRRAGVVEYVSHVYRDNDASMRLHRRLGFRVTREKPEGVEFRLGAAELLATPLLQSRQARARRPGAESRD